MRDRGYIPLPFVSVVAESQPYPKETIGPANYGYVRLFTKVSLAALFALRCIFLTAIVVHLDGCVEYSNAKNRPERSTMRARCGISVRASDTLVFFNDIHDTSHLLRLGAAYELLHELPYPKESSCSC